MIKANPSSQYQAPKLLVNGKHLLSIRPPLLPSLIHRPLHPNPAPTVLAARLRPPQRRPPSRLNPRLDSQPEPSLLRALKTTNNTLSRVLPCEPIVHVLARRGRDRPIQAVPRPGRVAGAAARELDVAGGRLAAAGPVALSVVAVGRRGGVEARAQGGEVPRQEGP